MAATPPVRIASTTEEALRECISRSLWAARTKLPRNWEPGEILVARVESSIAGVALVQTQLHEDHDAAFDPGFPALAKVDWLWTAQRVGERIPFGEWIKEELRSAWGPHYGFRVLNQTALPARQSKRILSALRKRLPALQSQIESANSHAGG